MAKMNLTEQAVLLSLVYVADNDAPCAKSMSVVRVVGGTQ